MSVSGYYGCCGRTRRLGLCVHNVCRLLVVQSGNTHYTLRHSNISLACHMENQPMLDPTLQPTIVDAHTGPTYRVVSDLVTFKALAADTNGAYSLFETNTE